MANPVSDSAAFTTPEASDDDLGDLLLEVLPQDGSTMGKLAAREALGRAAADSSWSSLDTETIRTLYSNLRGLPQAVPGAVGGGVTIELFLVQQLHRQE
jgi:hypothetical protein